MKTHLSCLIAALVFAGSMGCGSSPAGGQEGPSGGDGGLTDAHVEDVVLQQEAQATDSGIHDAAPEAAPVDHGAPSSTYPAFPPNVGQITASGGYVMKNPVIVPITWNADGSQSVFDGFVDTVGATAYWTATTKEYGVSAATSGMANHAHVSTTPPPAMLQDSDLQNMVKTNAGAAGGWPAPTQDTIYAFFVAPGTSLQVQGFGGGAAQDACASGTGGYHDQVTVGSVTTSYAVAASCNFGNGNTPEQWSTMAMSHELIEAVTDPQPQDTMRGYYGFDADHFGWDYFQQLQSEVGDACELYQASFFAEVETSPAPFNAWVQRTWSNAAIKAGHDPCVPAPAGQPYFNVTPLALGTVSYTLPAILTGASGPTVTPTKGLLVPAGKSKTIAVGFYSDGPTGGPWTISVSPGNPVLGSRSMIDMYNASTVSATVDKASGQNGEKAYVTVSVASPGTLFNGEIVTITSTLGGVSHYMPIWIGSM